MELLSALFDKLIVGEIFGGLAQAFIVLIMIV